MKFALPEKWAGVCSPSLMITSSRHPSSAGFIQGLGNFDLAGSGRRTVQNPFFYQWITNLFGLSET